ncbi:hypothetical protein D7V77_28655 [Corallococcus sp. CA041A]|nr:hypothetical protein D7V77_28655 [Corallococcus sp. CA041A]
MRRSSPPRFADHANDRQGIHAARSTWNTHERTDHAMRKNGPRVSRTTPTQGRAHVPAGSTWNTLTRRRAHDAKRGIQGGSHQPKSVVQRR